MLATMSPLATQSIVIHMAIDCSSIRRWICRGAKNFKLLASTVATRFSLLASSLRSTALDQWRVRVQRTEASDRLSSFNTMLLMSFWSGQNVCPARLSWSTVTTERVKGFHALEGLLLFVISRVLSTFIYVFLIAANREIFWIHRTFIEASVAIAVRLIF